MKRTKDKAEVFTPSWICNEQNNLVDDAWFGRKNVFNISTGQSWIAVEEKIEFPENKSWKDYVLACRLEVSCGEAPYLVSRYDTVSGMIIPIKSRIGLLDRKLRVVNEQCADEKKWIEWTKKAFKSTYGFEYQGDNVLLARENLLYTFTDYYEAKFGRLPELSLMREMAEIISWNIWQMDGLTFTAPFAKGHPEYEMLSLFDDEQQTKIMPVYCKIRDWQQKKKTVLEYKSLMKGGTGYGR